MISVDVVVLCKNNKTELLSTIQSVPDSNASLHLNLLIFDGSCCPILSLFSESELLLLSRHSFVFYYLPSLGISGIYPSMNYALSRLSSTWVIFMNSGDTFHRSLGSTHIYRLLSFSTTKNIDTVFGVANIQTIDSSISWDLPSKNLSKVALWLLFFEPIHQAMFVRTVHAQSTLYDITSAYYSDALWKRAILSTGSYLFVPIYICNFILGGASSSYNFKIFFQKINEPSRPFLQKLAEVLKFLLSSSRLSIPHLQKAKWYVINSFFG